MNTFGWASDPQGYIRKNENIIKGLWSKRNDQRPNVKRLHRATIKVAIRGIRSERG